MRCTNAPNDAEQFYEREKAPMQATRCAGTYTATRAPKERQQDGETAMKTIDEINAAMAAAAAAHVKRSRPILENAYEAYIWHRAMVCQNLEDEADTALCLSAVLRLAPYTTTTTAPTVPVASTASASTSDDYERTPLDQALDDLANHLHVQTERGLLLSNYMMSELFRALECITAAEAGFERVQGELKAKDQEVTRLCDLLTAAEKKIAALSASNSGATTATATAIVTATELESSRTESTATALAPESTTTTSSDVASNA